MPGDMGNLVGEAGSILPGESLRRATFAVLFLVVGFYTVVDMD
jgi:hypothetical protein